ncbi:MAG: PBP1A family penicillin-binding protein [Spirochaetia bacterium]|nr:PBP1A family penicillin-binding protein [Spirochaetia bacterium]
MRIIRVFARLIVNIIQFIYGIDVKKRKKYTIAISGFLFFILSAVTFVWIDFPSVANLKHYAPPVPSKLLDRKGRLISTFFTDNRIVVKQSDMPPYLTKAFIAIEDNQFYEHHGIDIQGVMRAAIKNIFFGGSLQGGSTITQQVTKVILTNRSRTFVRKFKEAFLALYLDFLFSKDEILNLYFNEIYFGHGNYGVEAASNFYFNKPASEISIGEAAILASLPSAPNKYSPVRNPHLSRQRVTLVLLRMIDMNYLSIAQATSVFKELNEYYSTLNISPDSTAFGQRLDQAPYYTEYMRGILEEKVGKNNLYTKGLTIYTSLDLDHQLAAQKALWDGLESQSEKGYDTVFTNHLEFSNLYSETIELFRNVFGLAELENLKTLNQYEIQLAYFRDLGDNLELLNHGIGSQEIIDSFINAIRENNPYLSHITPPQGALIEIDQKTGEVTAMVGGSPYNAVNQINRAIQMKRQPGSTFKPILYATAIDMKKITAASIFPDLPMIQPDSDGEYWIPENSSGGFRGFVTIREALTNSINMVSIGIAREVGLKNVLGKIAEQLHINEKDIPKNLTVALGSYEVSPFQLARAFTLFPRGGEDLEPFFLQKIVNAKGKVLFQHKFATNYKHILDPGTATIMTDLLQNVVDKGTGKAVRNVGYKGFAAGKTGTTSNFRDAWFVGFNDRYTSAVWIGYDKPSQSLGEGQYGGSIAAPIWGYFQYYTQNFRKKDDRYVIHEGVNEVEICKSTGKLPGDDCDEIIIELFLPETEPTEVDDETKQLKIGKPGELNSAKKKKADDKNDHSKLMEDIYQ